MVTTTSNSPVAKRLSGSKPSAMNKLLGQAQVLRAQGISVIDLAAGAPLQAPSAALLNAASAAILGGFNNYGDAAGLLGVRQLQSALIQQSSGVSYHPDTEITVTAGASAALQSVLLALCNPGDGVALFEPFYEAFLPLIKLAGGRTKFVRLHGPKWEINQRELDKALSGRTRFLLLNTPHNPTGRVFTRQELELIAGYCLKRNILVIADETYEPYVFSSNQHLSIAAISGMKSLSILIHSASKEYNVPGWRIGTVAAEASLSSAIRQVNAMSLGAPIPFQHALLNTLSSKLSKPDCAEHRQYYTPLMVALCEALEAAGFSAPRPEGTLAVLAESGKWSTEAKSSEELCDFVLKRFGILAVPGSPFFHKQPKELYLRFSFARSPQLISAAAASLLGLPDKNK